jgi:hypothetical protein
MVRTPGCVYGRLPVVAIPVKDFAAYFTEKLAAPPAEVKPPNLDYPMADNDRIGDCTIAAVVHVDQALSSLTGQQWTYPGDQPVQTEYFNLTGGKDTGLVETVVLKTWSTTPGLFTHELVAYAPIAVKHTVTIRQAVSLCGAVYTGVLIPAPAQQQFADGKPWELTHTAADNDIEGGHAVPIVGYNATGPIVVTWGALQQVTWEWWLKYAEEAYAVVTAEVKASGSLNGVDLDALESDLTAL